MVNGIKQTWDQQFPDLRENPEYKCLFSIKKKDWVRLDNEGRLRKIQGLCQKILYVLKHLFDWVHQKSLARLHIRQLVADLKPDSVEQHQRIAKLVRKKFSHIDPILARTTPLPKDEHLRNALPPNPEPPHPYVKLIEELQQGNKKPDLKVVEELIADPEFVRKILSTQNDESNDYFRDSKSLQYLFFVLLAPLSYNRSKIHPDLIHRLRSTFPFEVVVPSDQGTPPSIDFINKLIDGALALRLGVKMPQPNGGTSGTRFLVNYKGEKLGVFKPWDQAPHGSRNKTWTYWIKKHFVKWLREDSAFPRDEEYLAEQAAYQLGCIIAEATNKPDLQHVIPETFVVNLPRQGGWIGTKRGSLQMMAEGHSLREELELQKIDWLSHCLVRQVLDCPCQRKKLQEKLGFNEEWKPMTDKARQFILSYQFLMLIDFLIDNIDRHTENLFISSEGLVQGIDNGAAFSRHQATSFLSRRHKFETAVFKFAKKPINPSLVNACLHSYEKINDVLLHYLEDAQTGKGNETKAEKVNEVGQRNGVLQNLKRLAEMTSSFSIPFDERSPSVQELARVSCSKELFKQYAEMQPAVRAY
ncbi:MAG: hypothetical protein KGJ02_04125 [Verrucomicrobiota bacterium]|nr:hypothetical protein [Verrucomicrobiota bacterium]